MPRIARPPLSDESLNRIRPIVDELLTTLDSLLERLPPNTDSALVFELGPEDRE